jgi:hypothetical protein
MARTTKLNPETLDRLVEAVQLGATWEMAAAAAGVDVSTVHRWRADEGNCELRDRLKAAEAVGALTALRSIRDAAAGGTWQAAAWLLERRYPADYGRRSESRVEVSTPSPDSAVGALLAKLGPG